MHLLVCDDDESVGRLLHSIYTASGWTVDVVTSGRDCIDTVTASRPDVLVLDHMMPGLTGVETARILRRDGHSGPIILFSAYLGPDLQEAIRELDLKPVSKVDVNALMRIVDALVWQVRLD